MDRYAVIMSELTRQFGSIVAVDPSRSMKIKRGDIYGFFRA